MTETSTPAIQKWSQKYFRERDEVYSDIHENRQFNGIYLTMLIMAGLISLLGLLINSPAVIIGAMLISPLMGPILACGLALTMADWDLGKKGLRNIAFSVLEVLLITVLVATLSPLKDSTPEILARSNPNLMDLLIAFFSGIAGSIALTTRSKTGLTIIPGVAIATAVMPPLATVGYGIATAQWEIARGSFMLFFTNLVAIIISADLVFFVAGFRPRHRLSKGASPRFIRARGLIAVAILVVISIPLVRTLMQAAQQASARHQILNVLQSLEKPNDVQLGSWHFDLKPNKVVVDASITAGEPLTKDVIDQTQRMLSENLGRSVELHIRQIRVDDGRPGQTTHDFLSGGNLATAATPPKPPEEVLADYQNRIQKSLSELAKPAGFSEVKIRAVGMQADGSVSVNFIAKRDVPADPDVLAVLSSALERDLSHPVALQGDLHLASTKVTFVHGSSRLDRASTADIQKLRTMAKTEDQVEDGIISYAKDSTLNARRSASVEKTLGISLTSVVEESPDLDKDDAIVKLTQHFSIVSKPKAASPAQPQ